MKYRTEKYYEIQKQDSIGRWTDAVPCKYAKGRSSWKLWGLARYDLAGIKKECRRVIADRKYIIGGRKVMRKIRVVEITVKTGKELVNKTTTTTSAGNQKKVETWRHSTIRSEKVVYSTKGLW